MPAIGTSSDQYQHRDPALTTYRRNTAAPTLADAMTQRSEEKAKAAVVERRQVQGQVEPPKASTKQAVAAAPREAATPIRVLHELYAPPSRVKREHDDRYSMITGGTVDVRA